MKAKAPIAKAKIAALGVFLLFPLAIAIALRPIITVPALTIFPVVDATSPKNIVTSSSEPLEK